MESFELYIFSFQLMGFDMCALASRILIGVELILGLGLVSGIWRRAVNWLCAVMLGGFSLFLVWRMALGDEESCHCFGELLDMNPWQSLLKNAVLGGLLAVGWGSPVCDVVDWAQCLWKRLNTRLCRILSALAVTVAVFVTIFCCRPPGFYYRLVRHTTDLSVEAWHQNTSDWGVDEGRGVFLLFSPLCEHCQHCAAKVQTIIDRNNLDTSYFHVVFTTVTDRPEDMKKLVPYFYDKAGIEPFAFDTRIMGYEEFIPMTDGIMPLVCLFEDGVLVKEYSYNSLDEAFLVNFISCE